MILLHTCCGPCVLPIIEYLLKDKQPEEMALFFSNSNIFPREEHHKRLEAVRKIADFYKLKLYEDQYEHQDWLNYLTANLAQPLSSYPENNERCLKCFQFRLERTVQFAKTNGFKEFATTLSINLSKDTEFINAFGQTLAKKYDLKYEIINLDAHQAHKRERELNKNLLRSAQENLFSRFAQNKQHNLYHQKYCGCEFSI